MTDETIGFRFGANTAQFAGGAAEVKGLLAQIQAQVRSLGASFASLGGGSAFAGIEKGAATATASIKGMNSAMKEAGELLLVGFGVEKLKDFADAMGEAAEATYHQALTLGETVTDVQRFNATMVGLGIAPQAAETGMLRLSRSLTTAREGMKTTSAAFREIGVNIHAPMSETQLFQRAIEGLSKIQDQPTKLGLAFQLMGRNIQGIAPLLGMTKEQFDAVSAAVDESGAVDQVAWQKGMALAEAQNEQRVAMMGLKNVLTDALAPAFTAITKAVTMVIEGFVKSYKEGGTAKTVMDALGGAIRVVASLALGLGTALSLITSVLETVGNACKGLAEILIDVLGGAVKQVAELFGGLGRVAMDALTGHWDRVASDVKSTGDAFVGTTHATWAKVTADAGQAGKDTAASFVNGLKTAIGSGDAMKQIWAKGGPLPTPPTGKGGNLSDMQESLQKPKGDKGAESALDKLKDELGSLENDHNDTIQDMTAVELKFWQDVANGPKMATLSQREQAEVQRTIDRLKHQEAMKGIEDEIAAQREGVQRLTTQYEDGAARQRRAIENQISAVRDLEKARQISPANAEKQIADLYAQEAQIAKDTAQAVYEAHRDADEKIKASADRTTDEWKAAQKDETDAALARDRAISTADDDLSQHLQENARQTADEMRSQFNAVVDPLVSSFTGGLLAMARGTQTFGETLKKWGEQIVDDFVSQVVNKQIEAWLWGENEKTAATSTGVLARIGLEIGGFFTKLFSMLGFSVGVHAGTEAAKTGATATGVIARMALEIGGFFSRIVALLAASLGIHIATESAKTVATAAGATAQTAAKTAAAAAGAAAMKAIAATEVATLVGLAGAGGVASMAAAPFPVDLTAPAFGSAMAAAAAGFGSVALAAGGFDIPAGVNPLVQAHAEEMILPADLSNGIRSLIQTGSVGGAYGAVAGGAAAAASPATSGPVNLHYAPNISNPDPDLMRLVDKQGHELVRWMNDQVRANRIGGR